MLIYFTNTFSGSMSKAIALRINTNIKYNHLNWESLRNGMSMMTKVFGLWG